VPLFQLLLLGGGRWRPPIIRGFTGGQCAASACSAAGNAVDKHRAMSAFASASTTKQKKKQGKKQADKSMFIATHAGYGA
jgi:hypothetical protein